MEKKLLRKIHMEQIARLTDEEMFKADSAICDNILNLDEYRLAKNLFLYISVGKEVSTGKLVSQALKDGKAVYIPRCYGGGIMSAARLCSEDELVDGRYGIPTVVEENEAIAPEELDFILVPGVCFDKSGNRLGRGGGYYDRYLANNISAKLVGVCRDAQLLDAMDVDAHDRKVDTVVTDKEVVRVK